MKKVVLYYEDSGAPEHFALHDLVLSCIADRIGDPTIHYRTLKTIFAANPRNGRDPLLRACREDASGLPGGYWGGVGVVDGDEIHVPLGLGPRACKREVRSAFENRFGHSRTALFVIDSNTETILEAAAEELPGTAALLQRAVRGKKRAQRDQILFRAAGAPDRRVRDGILSRVPSLRRLVDKLACAYAVWLAED